MVSISFNSIVNITANIQKLKGMFVALCGPFY